MGRLAIGTRSWMLRWGMALALLVVWTAVASAELPLKIVRVEEDWELVIGTPNPIRNAPQIVTAISPVGHVESFHATFEVNHHTIPTFSPGGLQFEVWDGTVPMLERKFPNQALLATLGETIRWTHVMKLDGVVLSFEIVNGSSTTWGAFGGQGYLKDTVVSRLSDLNAYSPNVSVDNSGVNYAANRVQSLVLKRVRVYTLSGDVVEDATERVVHRHE